MSRDMLSYKPAKGQHMKTWLGWRNETQGDLWLLRSPSLGGLLRERNVYHRIQAASKSLGYFLGISQ